MAALRNGVRTVIIPQDNVRDLEEIDQTVRAALHFVPVTTVDDLREIDGGLWETLPFSELSIRYALDRAQWFTDLGNARCTGGETVAHLFDRVNAAARRIALENEGKTVLLATHWTPVLCLLATAQGYGLKLIRKCPEPKNASLQILRLENDTLLPEQLDITAHLSGLTGGRV